LTGLELSTGKLIGKTESGDSPSVPVRCATAAVAGRAPMILSVMLVSPLRPLHESPYSDMRGRSAEIAPDGAPCVSDEFDFVSSQQRGNSARFYTTKAGNMHCRLVWAVTARFVLRRRGNLQGEPTMSTGDQFISALVSSFFDIVVAVMLGVFNAVVLPLLQAIPGMLGISS
jgi:hypothetical protein